MTCRSPAVRVSPRRSATADGSSKVPIGTVSEVPFSWPGSRFIDGEPMKPATNRLAGEL